MMNRIWNEETGVLTFEWILLITLLVIGIVGGLAVMRDAYVIEAAETGEAMMALNQSYHIEPSLTALISTTGNGVKFSGTYTGSGVTYSTYVDKNGTITVKTYAGSNEVTAN